MYLKKYRLWLVCICLKYGWRNKLTAIWACVFSTQLIVAYFFNSPARMKKRGWLNASHFQGGQGKKFQNGQTEPKLCFGLPDGVHRYAERRSLFGAKRQILLILSIFAVWTFLTSPFELSPSENSPQVFPLCFKVLTSELYYLLCIYTIQKIQNLFHRTYPMPYLFWQWYRLLFCL